MKTQEKNCIPDGLETIEDKIEYVKSAYGIIGENGNLFDWLLIETSKDKIQNTLNTIHNNLMELGFDCLNEDGTNKKVDEYKITFKDVREEIEKNL